VLHWRLLHTNKTGHGPEPKIYALGHIIPSFLAGLLAPRSRCAGMKVVVLHRFAFGRRLGHGNPAGCHLPDNVQRRQFGFAPDRPGIRFKFKWLKS
jgi:hypothetical protein